MKRTWLCLILCCLGAMSGFAQKHTTFEMRYFSKTRKQMERLIYMVIRKP